MNFYFLQSSSHLFLTILLKSDVTIVFLDSDFLKYAKISAIRVYFKADIGLLIFAWISRPLSLK